MKTRFLSAIVLILLILTPVFAPAAGNDSIPGGDSTGHSQRRVRVSAVVAPFGMPVFRIYSRLGPFTPEQRADAVNKKIRLIWEDPFFRSDSIRLIEGEVTIDVTYGEMVITSVDAQDAKAEGTTRELVAKERRTKIIYAIQNQRMATSTGEIAKTLGISTGALFLLITLITLINRLFRRIKKRADQWQERIMIKLRMKDYAFFNKQRQLAILLILMNIIKWVLILVLLFATLLAIFYLLPWTKAFSLNIIGFVIRPLNDILLAFKNYFPNMITILVIMFVARLIIKLFRFLKNEVEKETLKIPGFYPDFALPTFNILRVLIILFTIVAVWPYLPGSDSQIFQGVSVMFGLVFSLTSASSLSNFMAGLTITYTRAFKLGDRVRIGEVTGDIIEKSMLVTRIRTIKNEEITVPNTKIMNSEVVNYSTMSQDQGLILNTTVTIGYDVPWRLVHRLLTEAARNTDLILVTPGPFVLQTALNDFYISYQLNAYTGSANKQAVIYSNLHQNIQDSFNKAGVEIMSPHYKAIRDGNTIAIPEENRPDGYTSPGFIVDGLPDSADIKV